MLSFNCAALVHCLFHYCVFSLGCREYGCQYRYSLLLRNDIFCVKRDVKIYPVSHILFCFSETVPSCALYELSRTRMHRLTPLSHWS